MKCRPAIDRIALLGLIIGGLVLAGRAWLDDHPQHNPWAPLDLRDPPGWATRHKLASLRENPAECAAVLERSGIEFVRLPAAGEGECRRTDRTVLSSAPLAPTPPPTTCAVAAGVALWLSQGVRPAAEQILGSRVARIEQLGAYSCRRLYGRASGRWSQHASGNALDVSAFVLADGTRISVADDWAREDDPARFLARVRDEACRVFGTVLSPDYNDAHADHFHFDQATRGIGGVCR